MMKNRVVFSDNLFCFSSDHVKTSESFTIQMDALVVGLPIIATRCSAIPETIDYVVTGLLSPPQNEVLFAKNIATLLTDYNLKKNMGITARQRALQFYDWNSIVEKFEGVLSEQSILHKIGAM